MSNTSKGGGNPWAWLGLLKWSLSYSDGTRKNDDITPMSKEDREFLEKVMAEGIIDENERMKFILQESTKAMEYYRLRAMGTNPDSDPPISYAVLCLKKNNIRLCSTGTVAQPCHMI
uniref:Uncharacterized protein n=1 Tax=Guillardia theta TaxID=55529 RepID=A0A7S4KBJ9_GUITH|mmetsp:Transcript_22647/g.74126  ORF Transcript_22647/g.74126 Transcript_22647/m.74126 type:complete len:117 (+) Transcript_22647:34-384(+)